MAEHENLAPKWVAVLNALIAEGSDPTNVTSSMLSVAVTAKKVDRGPRVVAELLMTIAFDMIAEATRLEIGAAVDAGAGLQSIVDQHAQTRRDGQPKPN